jgi:hypothetical protein
MALSMDEQRMLAEIERRLSAEDPGLAARLSSFRRPSPAVRFRSPRSRILGSMFAVALAVVISLMVYATISFRAHNPKGVSSPQASGGASASAPAKVPPKRATSPAVTTSTARSATTRTSTAAKPAAGEKSTVGKTATGKSSAAARASAPANSGTTGATHGS